MAPRVVSVTVAFADALAAADLSPLTVPELRRLAEAIRDRAVSALDERAIPTIETLQHLRRLRAAARLVGAEIARRAAEAADVRGAGLRERDE